MLASDLRIGNPIVIYIIRDERRYQITSKVEGTQGNNKVYISLISSINRIFHFSERDKVEVIYNAGGRMWKWTNVIGSIDMLNKRQVHSLTFTGEPEAYNRRDAFRVPVAQELIFEHYVKDDNSIFYTIMGGENVTITKFKGIIKDISELGVAIVANDLLEVDEVIGFTLHPKIGKIECKCEVVRRLDNTEGSYKYLYGCQIIESNTALLKRYVYETQRKYLLTRR